MTHPNRVAQEVIAGKYRLLRPLGTGSAAEAWEAENVLLGRRVAVKLLHPHLAEDAETRARFLAEARASARIAHRNVVDVYDIGVAEDGAPFLVMELCNGETLSSVIDGRGPMGVSYAADLVAQILSALHAAHELGIVHRDLKPDNVMIVHPRPDEPVVKVLDFGIAQGVLGEGHAAESGVVIGTPEYMPPEQARGERVDARADLYAAGVILFELLTGTVPFLAASPEGTLALVLTRPAKAPSRRGVELPEELDAIVLSALAKSPARRPQSARDFLEALAPFATPALRVPSLLPLGDSEPPLPLVSARPGTPSLVTVPSQRSPARLELVIETSPPPPPLLGRKDR
ncbi:MAG: protein kinase [Deltaproteobacteria bacterium]|nr:protein kinase [Deltaproteobacteria bacterium]